MSEHIETARKHLADLATLESQAERMERSILDSAQSRLEDVQRELGAMPVGDAMTDETKSATYRELIEERGILQQVISKARAELGSA